MIITIDGPAASGKSSIAKALAEKLNYYYLRSGLLYRAVAYIIINKLDSDVETHSNFSFIPQITYKYVDEEPKVFFDDEDITNHLSQSYIGSASSKISSKREVREKVDDIQREVAKSYNVVAEGRDCGSVVFPDAQYKFYLTADLEVRAKRALRDADRQNKDVDIEEVIAGLEERDRRDQEREVSPLIVPNGAIIIDNSELNYEETLQKFLSYIQ